MHRNRRKERVFSGPQLVGAGSVGLFRRLGGTGVGAESAGLKRFLLVFRLLGAARGDLKHGLQLRPAMRARTDRRTAVNGQNLRAGRAGKGEGEGFLTHGEKMKDFARWGSKRFFVRGRKSRWSERL